MARKRLNTKFLITLGGAVTVSLVVLLGLTVARPYIGHWFPQLKWMLRGTPAQHAAKAQSLYDQGDYEQAVIEYKTAMSLKGTPDSAMYTALGDCYSHLVFKDPGENLRLSKVYWDQALISDPGYMPALQRVLDLLEDDAERNRGSRPVVQWDGVQAAAAKILAVDPSNTKARSAQLRAVIQRWLAGAETEVSRIDEAMSGLLALAEQKPFNAEALYYVMIAKANRAVQRLSQNDRTGASAIGAEVVKMIDDALAAHPDDPELHYRSAIVLRFAGQIDRTVSQPAKYQDRVRDEFEKAASLVKPDDLLWSEIRLSWAKMLEMQNDLAGAEKQYRSMLADRPDEMPIRVALAELLARDPAKRAEAIDLLEHAPPPDMKRTTGVKAMLARNYETASLFTLINAKLDSMGAAKTPEESKALIKQAEEVYARVNAIAGVAGSAMALQAQGRIELAKGQNLQAKQTLQRALQMLPPKPSNAAEADQRFRLTFMLAGACLATEQTGDAKMYLTELVKADEKFTPTRIMLAQLLIREGRIDDARVHVDALTKLLPDSPVVKRLAIFTLDKDKEKDKISETYSQLPEATRDEKVDKAQMAVYCGKREEAVVLLETILKGNPNDLPVAVGLARLYADAGDKPRALALVDDAITKNPDRNDLKLVRAQIDGGGVSEVRSTMIDQETDPLRKELMRHDLAAQEGRDADARQYLQNAAKFNPDDGAVLDLQFRYAIVDKDWAKASTCLEALAKQNRDQAGGLLYRVRLALARGELKQASDLALQLTQKMSEFAQSWVVLGQVQRAQARYGESIQSFELALQKQSNNLDAIRGLIDSSYALNLAPKARQYIDMGRKMFPNNLALRELDLQHELAYGDPEKVIAPRQEMLKQAMDRKDPSEPRAWLNLGNAYLLAARAKDTPQAAKPLLEKARGTFKEASDKWPDEMAFVQSYADATVQLKDISAGEKAIQALAARPNWQGKPEPVLLLASYYGRAAKPAEQEKVLRDYLASSPGAVPVQVQLAALVAQQNKLDEALKILDTNSDDPTIRRQRIELQISAGRMNDAEKEIETALAASPNPAPVLLLRQAFVYLKSGRATQALQVLDKVLAQDPRNLEAMFYRAQIYVGAKKSLDVAIRDLQAVRDSGVNEVDARMVLAQAYHYSNDDEAAMRELEDSVKLRPLEKLPRMQLLDYYLKASPPRFSQAERLLREARNQPQLANDVEIIQAEAKMWLQRKDMTKAGDAIAQAIKLAPDNAELFRTSCEVMLQSKQYAQLLTRTDAMVKQKKAPWWVYQFRGRAKKATEDRQGALDEFSAGIDAASAGKDDNAVAAIIQTIVDEIGAAPARARIFPRADKGENRWRMMLANLMLLDDDVPGAITWMEKVMNDPNTTPDELDAARRMVGPYYLRLNPPDTAKAVDVYRKLLDRDPNDPVALNNLACTMILPKSGFTPKDALKYSQQAYDQFDKKGEVNAYIYDTQGYLLVLTGRATEGITILRKAVDKEPFAEACYHLGEAYLAMPTPMKAEAEEALKQAGALLDAATRDNKPLDSELKSKIDKALALAGEAATTRPR